MDRFLKTLNDVFEARQGERHVQIERLEAQVRVLSKELREMKRYNDNPKPHSKPDERKE